MAQTIVAQVAELERMTQKQLRERWGVLFNTSPPEKISRQQTVARLAYRLQELVFGGLPDEIRQQLEQMGESHTNRGTVNTGRPVTGTRFIREWNGNRYEVEVLDKGFSFNGKQYRSLTAIATEITGTKWNGNNFFGLQKKGK